MKQASDRKLSELNDFFDQRPPADYNLLREWQPTQVSLLLEGIADAFKSGKISRHEPVARDYLVSMLPSRERKQGEKPRSKPRPTPTGTPKS